MKHFILLLSVFITANCFSQTEYYSTNGKNRLTKGELDVMISKAKQQYKEFQKKGMSFGFRTNRTEEKKDSIIHYVDFKVSGGKTTTLSSLMDQNPLSGYINKKLPAFEFKTLDGETLTLDQLKGKPTLINFWFTKCVPCINEMPALNKIYKVYKNDFNFVTITYESQKSVASFLKKHPFDFKHLVDAKDFVEMLKLQAYPTNLFLDKTGTVKYVRPGIPQILDANGTSKAGDGTEFIELLKTLKQDR